MCSRLCHRLRFIIFLPRFRSAELSWQQDTQCILYIYVYVLYALCSSWSARLALAAGAKIYSSCLENVSARGMDSRSVSLPCWRASMATWSALLDGAADPLEIVLGSWAAAKIYPGPQVVRQPTRMRIPLSGARSAPSVLLLSLSWFIFHSIRILFIRFSARTHKVWVSYLFFGLLKLIKNVLVCSNETPQIEF